MVLPSVGCWYGTCQPNLPLDRRDTSMTTLLLLVLGFALIGHNMALIGIISLIAAFCFSPEGKRLWCVLLALVLLLSNTWPLAAMACGLCAVFGDGGRRSR
jgi:hypothetical protein